MIKKYKIIFIASAVLALAVIIVISWCFLLNSYNNGKSCFIFELLEDGTYSVHFTGMNVPKKIKIPQKYNGRTVTEIGLCNVEMGPLSEFEFDVEEIIIPDTVEIVEFGAFYQCTNLKKIKIGANVSDISGGGFVECSINEIDLSKQNHNYTIKSGCLFKDTTLIIGINDTDIPDGTTIIGEYSFSGRDIDKINIPKTCTIIEPYAFYYCKNLEKAILADSVSIIGTSAFSHCEMLKNISIPNGISQIGEYAFSFSGLETLTIPGNINTIEKCITFCCFNLKEIIIAEGVKYISSCAFDCCYALKYVKMPESMEKVELSAVPYNEGMRVDVYNTEFYNVFWDDMWIGDWYDWKYKNHDDILGCINFIG